MKHILLTAIFIIFIISMIAGFMFSSAVNAPLRERSYNYLPSHINTDTETMIRQMAAHYGINADTAVRIAWCESKMGKYKHNWEGSSAKGVYMFIDKTWANYCEGDVLDDIANTRCFARLYNQYSHWWVCK